MPEPSSLLPSAANTVHTDSRHPYIEHTHSPYATYKSVHAPAVTTGGGETLPYTRTHLDFLLVKRLVTIPRRLDVSLLYIACEGPSPKYGRECCRCASPANEHTHHASNGY